MLKIMENVEINGFRPKFGFLRFSVLDFENSKSLADVGILGRRLIG